MAATYMHVGIPVTNCKPGMTYNEAMKFWVSDVDDYDFKIEYLKFEAGTPFPEEMHHRPHIAYRVDDAAPYLAQADRVIFGPTEIAPGVRIAFIVMDDTIFELYEDNS